MTSRNNSTADHGFGEAAGAQATARASCADWAPSGGSGTAGLASAPVGAVPTARSRGLFEVRQRPVKCVGDQPRVGTLAGQPSTDTCRASA